MPPVSFRVRRGLLGQSTANSQQLLAIPRAGSYSALPCTPPRSPSRRHPGSSPSRAAAAASRVRCERPAPGAAPGGATAPGRPHRACRHDFATSQAEELQRAAKTARVVFQRIHIDSDVAASPMSNTKPRVTTARFVVAARRCGPCGMVTMARSQRRNARFIHTFFGPLLTAGYA